MRVLPDRSGSRLDEGSAPFGGDRRVSMRRMGLHSHSAWEGLSPETVARIQGPDLDHSRSRTSMKGRPGRRRLILLQEMMLGEEPR